jgi:hypothetical protein
MGKKGTKASEDIAYSFPRYKSYSVEEILAAGGPTVFAHKLGKNPQTILEKLKKLPKESFLTNEEARQALEALKEYK